MSMLIKIGDVWVDPLTIEAAYDGVWDHDAESLRMTDEEGIPCTTLVRHDAHEFYVDGTTAEDAVAAINRCREQSMATTERHRDPMRQGFGG